MTDQTSRPDRRRYTYSITFSSEHPDGLYQITDIGDRGYSLHDDPVVWTTPYVECDDGQPPEVFRQKYEELLRESGWQPWVQEVMPNIVEMINEGGDCAWDQPCVYGHRVEEHAVYCHNEAWLYAPRKCRRHADPSPWSGKPWPHEGCAGFKANPIFEKAATDAQD